MKLLNVFFMVYRKINWNFFFPSLHFLSESSIVFIFFSPTYLFFFSFFSCNIFHFVSVFLLFRLCLPFSTFFWQIIMLYYGIVCENNILSQIGKLLVENCVQVLGLVRGFCNKDEMRIKVLFADQKLPFWEWRWSFDFWKYFSCR